MAEQEEGRARSAATIVAGLVGLFLVVAGLWAFLAPRPFFDALAVFEPYNAHFIRDIGAFQIGLGAVLLLALRLEDALTVALGGVGAGALFHAAAHVIDRDLGGTPATDIPFFGVMAVVLLAAAFTRRRA
ncbi:MAG TPA: hypothetical protein VNU01_02525 [Egibacteraceae bacterium]|nr:hypothetical protein [Egibacteraceae bacterium]